MVPSTFAKANNICQQDWEVYSLSGVALRASLSNIRLGIKRQAVTNALAHYASEKSSGEKVFKWRPLKMKFLMPHKPQI
jgi:hypothetical protein